MTDTAQQAKLKAEAHKQHALEKASPDAQVRQHADSHLEENYRHADADRLNPNEKLTGDDMNPKTQTTRPQGIQPNDVPNDGSNKAVKDAADRQKRSDEVPGAPDRTQLPGTPHGNDPKPPVAEHRG